MSKRNYSGLAFSDPANSKKGFFYVQLLQGLSGSVFENSSKPTISPGNYLKLLLHAAGGM